LVPPDLARTVENFRTKYERLEQGEASWRRLAACASRAVPALRWFFPDQNHLVPGSKKIRRARRTCALCPVRRPCLLVALAGELEGVWGGTTEEDREAVSHLPLPAQAEALEAEFRSLATTGPWRVVGPDEYVEAAVRGDDRAA
jgi:WhiB family redox-sensing transcriptional regulator